MRQLPIVGAALWLALAPLASAQSRPANGESWALFQGLRASRRIEFVAPAGVTERAATRLAQAVRQQSDLGAALAQSAPDPDAVRVLVGAASDTELLELAHRCGVEPLSDGFQCFGREYRAAGDALCAVFEDPEHPGRPLCLFLGNDVEALAEYLTEVPRLSRPHLRVWADGLPDFECPLEPSGWPRSEEVSDYLTAREAYFGGGTRQELGGVTLVLRGAAGESSDAYGKQALAVHDKIVQWFGPPPEAPPTDPEAAPPPPAPTPAPIEVFVYEHAEDLRACTGAEALLVVDPLRPRVHVLVEPGVPDDGGRGVALVTARGLAGPPADAWLWDGLSVAAAGRWWQHPLTTWVAFLSAGKLVPSYAELTGPAGKEPWSEHVLVPMRAFLFQLLVGPKVEPGKLRALWKGAPIPAARARQLMSQGLAKLAGPRSAAPPKAGQKPQPKPEGERPAAGAKPKPGSKPGAARAGRASADTPASRGKRLAGAPLRHGVALLETPEAAYGSRAVGAALDAAVEAKADACSLTVLASARPPAPPLGTLALAAVHGSASDVALASAVAEARARKLRILLALEPLGAPGSWIENVSDVGPEVQAGLWADYRRMVVHYGLLCELLKVEVFSLGSSLTNLSRTDAPEDEPVSALTEVQRAGWRELIRAARGAFHGGLTYTARLPGEAHEVAFWDQLDFVSLAIFPSLAREGQAPDDGQLERVLRLALGDALALALRWNQPLLVTQIGLPARAESWAKPSVASGAEDPEAQARFVRALAAVVEHGMPNQSALRGLFLWSWPVSAAERHDHSLRGLEPALLARLFAR